MAELDALRVATVLAADTNLQLIAGLASTINAPANQLANTAGIKGLEGVSFEDASFFLIRIVGEKAPGVIATEAHRGLRKVVGAEREKFGDFGDLFRE